MKLGRPPTLAADRARALYLAACAGLLCFSAGFVLTATIDGLSLPWYEPLQRRWEMAAVAPTGVAMDFFGRLFIAALAGIAGGVIGWAFARKKPVGATGLRAVSIWALGMTVLGLFLYAWALGNRVIVTGHH